MIHHACAAPQALSDLAAAATLAAAADDAGGRAMLARLLRHELASTHVLMMRSAGQANRYIGRIDPAGDESRIVREAVRMSGIAARLMDRYRCGFLALTRLDAATWGNSAERMHARAGSDCHDPCRSTAVSRADLGLRHAGEDGGTPGPGQQLHLRASAACVTATAAATSGSPRVAAPAPAPAPPAASRPCPMAAAACMAAAVPARALRPASPAFAPPACATAPIPRP